MTELLQFDEQLFRLINMTWHNDFLDTILPFWRNKVNWIPLYLFMIILIIRKMKVKSLYLLLGLGLMIGASDTISSQVIKKSVKRERPCRAAQLEPDVRLLVHCGGGYSFTSSHATNHFAIAVFLVLTAAGVFGYWRYLLLLWAFFVAYAQVYVGVHYPVDVFFGALLGSFIAWVFASIVNRFILKREVAPLVA